VHIDAGVLAVAPLDTLDLDRARGCVRDAANAYSADGGLAVLHGKPRGPGLHREDRGRRRLGAALPGHAIVFESEDEAQAGILGGKVQPGTWCRSLRGAKGGPGMQEMLKPTGFLKARGLDKVWR